MPLRLSELTVLMLVVIPAIYALVKGSRLPRRALRQADATH